MNYIDGISLKEYLKQQGGKLPVLSVLQMMEPVILSLADVHASGMIHRDISPDNIMVKKDGTVRLIDFGAARSESPDGEKSLSIVLRRGYAPEEQYRSRGKQGPWTDVYAICATIYRCITGETPPEALERLTEDDLAWPSRKDADITTQQENALMAGLAVRTEQRIQSMQELYARLYEGAAPVKRTVREEDTIILFEEAAGQLPPEPSVAKEEVRIPPALSVAQGAVRVPPVKKDSKTKIIAIAALSVMAAVAVIIAVVFALVSGRGSSEAPVDKQADGNMPAPEDTAGAANEASASDETPAAQVTPPAEGEIVIWHRFTDAKQAYLQKTIEDFNASHPGMVVRAEMQDSYSGDYNDKVYQAVMTGNGPDIIIDYASVAARFVSEGKLIDMEQYLSKDTIARLPDGARTEATSFSDGKMHFLPIHFLGPIFFYNKEIYDALGLSAPMNWEELQENCRVIKEAYPDRFGFAFDSEVDGALMLMMQTGNRVFDNDNIYFNTQEVAKQLQYYQDNIVDGYFTNVTEGNYVSEDFNAGRIVSYIGSVAGKDYLEIPFDMASVPQSGGWRWTPGWTSGVIIFNRGDESKARIAAAFTDYLASPEVNAGWCVAFDYAAILRETAETQTYHNYFISSRLEYTFLHPEYAGSLPALPAQQQVRMALSELMAGVAGGIDVNTALDQAVKSIEESMSGE